MNERKVPKEQRAAWPLLISKNRILGLAGLEIDHVFRVTESTTKVLVITLHDQYPKRH